jgi:fatty acid desaturase
MVVVYPPLSFAAACALRGFDNLTHEASHYNLFTAADLHQRYQFLFAYPVFKTLQDYRAWHLRHHSNYRRNKANDPDTAQNIRWGVEDLQTKTSFWQVAWFYVLRFFLLYYVYDNIRYNLIPHIGSKKSVTARIIFWGLVLTTVSLSNSWTQFLFGYLIPYLVWLPYIRFVTESSKHTNVNLQDDFANSRNNIGLLHQLFLHPHNDGFHQMHHLAANIPFYNLKKAYRFIKTNPEVRSSVIESSNPIQTIKQIFKKQ